MTQGGRRIACTGGWSGASGNEAAKGEKSQVDGKPKNRYSRGGRQRKKMETKAVERAPAINEGRGEKSGGEPWKKKGPSER